MTLEQLRIFRAVADDPHFTRAAAALGLTQSAVSAAIAALEGQLGLTLFNRVGRRVEVTAEGRIFAEEALHVLAAARHAAEVADELSGLARGSLRAMGSQTVAAYWLVPRLNAFHARYPGITVSLGQGNTRQVADAVREGRIDLGIVEGEVTDPDLTCVPVAEDRMAVVVGAAHADVTAREVTAPLLAGLPWVLREEGSGTRATTLSFLASHGVDIDTITVALEVPSNEAARIAVEAGAGATVLSLLSAREGIARGTLLALGAQPPARRFWHLSHQGRRPSLAARAFLAQSHGE